MARQDLSNSVRSYSERSKSSMATHTPTTITEVFSRWRCCVIVPTYNNAGTLGRVLNGLLDYAPFSNIIVVNDGSTDGTRKILNDYRQIRTLHLERNQGKGHALRLGFDHALSQGFHFAVTIDSDGQHYPDDLPVFLEALEENHGNDVLLIGSRNMGDESVPKNSSFGNRFSNFWFWVETGIWLTDTQCGYRLYPIHALRNTRFYTPKFEFEIEVIVRASWQGIPVRNVPVQVLYDPEERVSHFRPILDFVRISVLNTVLVLVALLYIKPRDLWRRLKKKGVKRFVLEDFLHNNDTPRKKALSIALGVFIGLSPLWGFHTVIVLFLALFLRLNKVIAFAFSNISLPPFIPFVLYASTKAGQWATGNQLTLSWNDPGNLEVLGHLETYIIGSLVLATCSAMVLGSLGFVLLTVFGKKKMIVDNG